MSEPPRLPFASSLDLAFACPASAALAKVYDAVGEPAIRGNVFHKFCEDSRLVGRDEALKAVPSEYSWWINQCAIDRIFAGLNDVLLERAFAIDVEARIARLLPKAEHWQYRGEPTEFLGICDLWAIDAAGMPVVGDHKTGRKLDRPSQLSQMKFFAAAAYLMRDKPSFVEARIHYIEPDGNVAIETELVSADECEKFITTLVNLRRKIVTAHEAVISGRAPTVSVGEHCRFAKCYASCPAKIPLLTKTLPEVDAILEQLEMMTPAAIGWAYMKVKELKAHIERLEDVAEEAAKMSSEPLPLPNGKVLKFVEQRGKKTLNQSKLIQLAKSKGAADADIAACYSANFFTAARQVKQTGA